MTDQGWMVDDGTCDPCVQGFCERCVEPLEWETDDHGILLVCCCNEHYRIGHADYPEVER